jgi:Rrf2 family protein
VRPLDAKTRYALLAALDLARHYDGASPVSVADIASHTGIPRQYLTRILLDLKAAVLVNSTRGAAGGYWLTRPPAQITVADIVAAVKPQPAAQAASERSALADDAVLEEIWAGSIRAASASLAQTSLADIIA